MIRLELHFDYDVDHFAENYADVIDSVVDAGFQLVADAYTSLNAPMVEDMQTQAPPVKYPIEWTSLAQKIAVRALLRANNNLPYQRTGVAELSWESQYIAAVFESLIRLQNPAPHAIFVGGGLSLDPVEARRFQQKFHQNTGWQPYNDKVLFWFGEIRSFVVDGFGKTIGTTFQESARLL